MGRARWALVWPFLGLATGCLTSEAPTTLVAANPFGAPPPSPPATRASFAPAPLEPAARVDSLGRKLLAANPQLGVRPLFRTIGAPQPEIFHVGTSEIDLTVGLVNQCATEGQLAAVLCHQLGKMIAERETLAGPQARDPERPPPMEVRVGNDNAGSFGPADQTHLAELAKFDRERRRSANQPSPPPNPQTLARTYLTKAGYTAGELDAAAPALQAAAENHTFAKQLFQPSAAQGTR
jgi:hypothetical protein